MKRFVVVAVLAFAASHVSAALYTVRWEDGYEFQTDTDQFRYQLTPYLEVSTSQFMAVHQSYADAHGHIYMWQGTSNLWQTLTGSNSIGFDGWDWGAGSITMPTTRHIAVFPAAALPSLAAQIAAPTYTTPAPEPGTLVLLASGLLAAGAMSRRW